MAFYRPLKGGAGIAWFVPGGRTAQVGVGIDVPILYGLQSQEIRTDMFKDGVGVLRTIRHIRFGVQKSDPVYVRVGQLSGTMIGYGGLVNNYSNGLGFEKRKFGLHTDINYKGYGGIEAMYSDFDPSSMNLLVIRPYVRPIAFLGIPIVSTLEVGATIVKDKDQTKTPVTDSTYTTNVFTEEGIGAFGIDAGMTLLQIPFIQIDLFANYGRLDMDTKAMKDTVLALSDDLGYKNSSGVSAGINFRFNFIANVMRPYPTYPVGNMR